MEFDLFKIRDNLWLNYKTVSGLPVKGEGLGSWYEMYLNVFCDELDAMRVTTDADYAALFGQMIQYKYVGDFLTDENLQRSELAAFGLIVFDRLYQMEKDIPPIPSDFGKISFAFQQMFECYEYISLRNARSNLAKKGAMARHREMSRARKFVVDQWTLVGKEYQLNKSAFARDYSRRVKNEHGVDVTDKTIREVWLSGTPFAGKQAG
jgi:hypothetical protein